MNGQEKQKLRSAFESILRADYITLDNLNELGDLEEYFIDFFGILESLLQKQDNFISGRRGTGKTTNLLRGYYECLKSIAPKLKSKERLISRDKILPIYIDLSTCNDLFDSKNDLNLIEIHFIRQIIESLKKQLNLMFEEKFLAVFSKENPALDDLDFIERVLVEGITLSSSKQVSLTSERKATENTEVSGEISSTAAKVSGKRNESYEISQNKTVDQIKGLNVQEFLNKISDIKN
ncbi:TPA: hypothetical protein ACGFX1_003662, partial [Vibrio cholerae]